MTYMFEVTVKSRFVGGGVSLPVGLSVKVAYGFTSSPVLTAEGKKLIQQAFLNQCGLDLSKCPTAISSGYMEARRM